MPFLKNILYHRLPRRLSPVQIRHPMSNHRLSTRAMHPVLTSRQDLMGEGTYPRATRLKDGWILGVHTSFQGDLNIIITVRSVDNGAAWSPVSEVCLALSFLQLQQCVVRQNHSSGQQLTRRVGDIDNPFILQLPNGRILCAFRNHSKDSSSGWYTYFRITLCYSDKRGAA
jgi:hypothetical protein